MMIIASDVKKCEDGCGPMPLFSDFDCEGLCDLCDGCCQKSRCQCKDGGVVPALRRHEKEESESVGSTAAWTRVETKTEGEDTWSVVHDDAEDDGDIVFKVPSCSLLSR